MTSPTRGSRSKTRWPRLPYRRQCRRRDGGHARPLLALSLGIATALVFLWAARDRFGRPAEPPPPDTRVVRLTDLPGLEESPAISPDGKSVAFTAGVGGKRQLFVQLIAGGAPLQITRDPVDHEYPRWSPDSSSIFYFSPAAPGELPGKHLGDPGAWRRATARRQQRGRCRRQPDGWAACALPAGEGRHPAGDRANGRFQVRRGRRVRARHLLLVSALVAGRQMDCLSARRQRQVRRVRGAGSWRRTAPVDA